MIPTCTCITAYPVLAPYIKFQTNTTRFVHIITFDCFSFRFPFLLVLCTFLFPFDEALRSGFNSGSDGEGNLLRTDVVGISVNVDGTCSSYTVATSVVPPDLPGTKCEVDDSLSDGSSYTEHTLSGLVILTHDWSFKT